LSTHLGDVLAAGPQPIALTGPCQFQSFPGTVGWMRGFLQFSLSPVFHLSDPARNGIFHQGFYVHARGTPRSPFPCLDASNNPTDDDSTTGTCKKVEPLCFGRKPGDSFCDGATRVVCGPDLVDTQTIDNGVAFLTYEFVRDA
jgi:hypothetical protein